MKINKDAEMNRIPIIGCTLLALLATTISLSLSVLTGLQFGQSMIGKLVMAAFGVLSVLGAHLLFSLCRPASIRVRCLTGLLWLFCILYVAYSHASFFLLSQQQAGMRRATFSDGFVLEPEPKRNLTAILSDQAKIKTELAVKHQSSCLEGCFRLKAKAIRLEAELEMLNAEADEVKRWQAHRDRQDEIQEGFRDDPVMTRLAKWLGVTEGQIGLVMGLLFSFILEGVACLCWYVAFQFRDLSLSRLVTEPVIPVSNIVTLVQESVASALELKAVDDIHDVPSSFDHNIELKELTAEVTAGRLKLTVNDIRTYCRCSQKRAGEFRRQIAANLNGGTQAC